MKIVKSKSVDLEQIIKQFDESILLELVQLAFQCRKDTEGYNLRNELYKSKYKASNLERKELELERFLQSFQNIRTENQNKEYKWVKINTDKMADIRYRFYIAPNPNNLHELVQRLTEAFSKANVPVRFKYQLTTNMEQCDRIIVYTDYNNKDLVEQTINSVYQSSKRLFEGCERSPAWIYDSKTPGVYFAPETPKAAYSERLTDALLEAKLTFNYLYGMTNSNKSITFSGNDTTDAINNMKTIITSIMLRKGLLLSKDGKCITIKDKNVKVSYDYETGTLEHFNIDQNGYTSVKFYQTKEGKQALVNNFYSLSQIKQQPGLQIRTLTQEERQQELNKMLYPEKYNIKKEESTAKK